MAISRKLQVSWHQNVSILDFIGARITEVVSGDNWSYKTCKAPVTLSLLTRNRRENHWKYNTITHTHTHYRHWVPVHHLVNLQHPNPVTCDELSTHWPVSGTCSMTTLHPSGTPTHTYTYTSLVANSRQIQFVTSAFLLTVSWPWIRTSRTSFAVAFINSGSYAASGDHYQQTPGKPWLLHSSPVELITATAFCTTSLHESSVNFRWFWTLLPVWSLVLTDTNTSRRLLATCFIGCQCHSVYSSK